MDWDSELAWEAADELDELVNERHRLLDALTAIRDMPSQRDLLLNAEVKALWYIANEVLNMASALQGAAAPSQDDQ